MLILIEKIKNKFKSEKIENNVKSDRENKLGLFVNWKDRK